jgi:5-methylcytosine-specific restriction endonuclease McrA
MTRIGTKDIIAIRTDSKKILIGYIVAKSKIEWHQKTAAKRLGITLQEYQKHLFNNEKWCITCRCWHGRGLFGSDKSRGDGKKSNCNNKAKRKPLQLSLFAKDEKRLRANQSYRKYYASKAGEDIRQRIYARKRNTEPIPGWWRSELLENSLCAYCDNKAETVDHVIPISRGGRTEEGNLVPSCKSCNSKKKNSDPNLWIGKMREEQIERIGVQPFIGLGALEIIELLGGYDGFNYY